MTTHRAELRARYPAILERASLSYGPGWAGLMETLCERLQFHANHNTMPPVEITQAKEKWGELTYAATPAPCRRGQRSARAARHTWASPWPDRQAVTAAAWACCTNPACGRASTAAREGMG